MIDVGQTYRATCSVVDDQGQPANPDAAELTVTLPDQTTATPAVTLPPAIEGLLVVDYKMTQPGLHKFSWLTTDPDAATTDYESARDYKALISLSDARTYLGVQDTTKDQLIRVALGAATVLTERICGTCIVRQITNDWITGDVRDAILLPHGPLVDDQHAITVTSVQNGGPAWSLTDLIVNPVAATLRLRSWLPFWFGPWQATYTAGRPVISEGIEQGYKEILWDLYAVLRYLTADQLGPDLNEVASFETAQLYGALPPVGYRVPARALMWFGGEARPGFA